MHDLQLSEIRIASCRPHVPYLDAVEVRRFDGGRVPAPAWVYTTDPGFPNLSGGTEMRGFSSMATRSVLIGSLALCLTVVAQESGRQRSSGPELKAFLGSWELDTARTKLGSTTVTYEQVGDSIRAITPLGTYTFKIDGTEYKTTLPGDTITWRQVDKNTLESTRKRNGKPESISTRVFSPDGKTIAVTTKVIGDQPTR